MNASSSAPSRAALSGATGALRRGRGPPARPGPSGAAGARSERDPGLRIATGNQGMKMIFLKRIFAEPCFQARASFDVETASLPPATKTPLPKATEK